MFETKREVSEIKSVENREEQVDKDFEKKLNDRFEASLNGKDTTNLETIQRKKEELINLKLETIQKTKEELYEYREKLTDEGDGEPNKVRKRTR
ncbi:hypothetical protein [Zhenpiania hominis]|uniref:hypothetical protein n=1 Tax=Zhenpiania hominis TaxID=2763644 RepID=UPI0039F5B865